MPCYGADVSRNSSSVWYEGVMGDRTSVRMFKSNGEELIKINVCQMS